MAPLHVKELLKAAPFSRQRELYFLVHVAKTQADSLHFSNHIFFFPSPKWAFLDSRFLL